MSARAMTYTEAASMVQRALDGGASEAEGSALALDLMRGMGAAGLSDFLRRSLSDCIDSMGAQATQQMVDEVIAALRAHA
jgi:hypothetical protein